MTPERSTVDVSVIIVNWHSRELLRACLESMRRSVVRASVEVVVIDAASFDGCGEMLAADYPHVRFIQSAGNDGFARSNNRAAERAQGRHLLFLNPDTELVGPAIETLLGSLVSLPRAGLVGAKLLNADGTVQTSCVQAIPTIPNQLLDSEYLRRLWPGSRLWGNAALSAPGMKPREVEAVSGACLMIARDLYERVGGFSEDYFMYAEDIDLAYKVQQAGYRIYYVPEAVVIHHGGQSSGQRVNAFAAVMMPEAIARFLSKTRGRTYGAGYRAALGLAAIGRLAVLAPSRYIRSNASVSASVEKWRAVLQWSVGRAAVVKQHYRPVSRGRPARL